MRKILVLMAVCILFGSAYPFYDYMLILPPVDTVIFNRWQETETKLDPVPPRRSVPEAYHTIFAVTSELYGIPPGVLESIAFVESGYRAGAISPVRQSGHSDLGMFQFNALFIEWYADQYNGGVMFDPFSPIQAIHIAARHITFLYRRYGNWMDTLLAYNCGMNRVENDKIPESAWDYLRKIYQ